MSDPAPFPRPLFPLPARLAVLLSGRGSNFEALADACERGELPGRIVLVASDVADAGGLGKAKARGISPAAMLGQPFRTATDTEVLLEACAAWGIEKTLERAVGMFAFGLWDAHTRELRHLFAP